MKRLALMLFAMMTFNLVYGQDEATTSSNRLELFLKGGFGTSWIILPKVFLANPNPPNENSQILPATNGVNGFVGLQTVLDLGNGWLFVPEVDLTYTGGEVRISSTDFEDNGNGYDTLRSSVQKLQSYVRAEIPLHFGVRSSDGFWVTFGPTLYFTLHDNKGFDEAVKKTVYPETPPQINSDNPFGLRFRLAAYAKVGERGYIDIKFESDLGQNFDYRNNTYEAKFSMQNLSIGYGYWLNKK